MEEPKVFPWSKIVPGSAIRAPKNNILFQGPGRALCAIQQGGGYIVLHSVLEILIHTGVVVEELNLFRVVLQKLK
jgi:hypothetical protein